MGLSHDAGDCSDRICPFELSWVDTPDVNGLRHKYAECSAKGICNRGTGECECFEGYEGKACARTTCPNDCSGHGTCEYIEDLGYGTVPNELGGTGFSTDDVTFSYQYWDKTKTRGCVCDPGYGDVDCSKRLCQYGTDTQDHRYNSHVAQTYHSQLIKFNVDVLATRLYDRTFSLTFNSKINETFTTIPIVLTSDVNAVAEDVKNALLTLPNNVIDGLTVEAAINGLDYEITITFTGHNVQGDQYPLIINEDSCGNGCTPKLTGIDLVTASSSVAEATSADFNSYECGRRGKCDYDTGICQCFEGFTGASCSTCTALI